jgi:hypothetical protein
MRRITSASFGDTLTTALHVGSQGEERPLPLITRPEGFADLAREVVNRNPDVIVAIGGPITQAVSAATGRQRVAATTAGSRGSSRGRGRAGTTGAFILILSC